MDLFVVCYKKASCLKEGWDDMFCSLFFSHSVFIQKRWRDFDAAPWDVSRYVSFLRLDTKGLFLVLVKTFFYGPDFWLVGFGIRSSSMHCRV